MKIAPQTYYRWLACPVTPAELEEAYLVNQIVDIYRRNKSVYGVRKMWHAARRVGLRIGRDQVGRLMRIAGIQGVRRGVHHTTTTVRDERASRHPNWSNAAGRHESTGRGLGRGLHLRMDGVRVLLRIIHYRRVLAAHSRLAGVDEQDHRSGHRCARAGARDPPPTVVSRSTWVVGGGPPRRIDHSRTGW